jgi:dTMP kinase
MDFHKRVRDGYLALAHREPHRVKVVKADGPVAKVHAEICKLVDAFLVRRRGKDSRQ